MSEEAGVVGVVVHEASGLARGQESQVLHRSPDVVRQEGGGGLVDRDQDVIGFRVVPDHGPTHLTSPQRQEDRLTGSQATDHLTQGLEARSHHLLRPELGSLRDDGSHLFLLRQQGHAERRLQPQDSRRLDHGWDEERLTGCQDRDRHSCPHNTSLTHARLSRRHGDDLPILLSVIHDSGFV